MKTVLLSIADLAERWQCNTRTISKYISEGKLQPCIGLPKVLFREDYIEQLEGVKLDRLSPLERRKLVNKIEELESRINMQNEILIKLSMLGAECMNFLKAKEGYK